MVSCGKVNSFSIYNQALLHPNVYFSLLANTFQSQQTSVLEDYIELSLMLQ